MSQLRSAGRVAIVDKGSFNASTTYERLDLVEYNGGRYLGKKNTIPTGTLPTNSTYWTTLIEPVSVMTSSELQALWND